MQNLMKALKRALWLAVFLIVASGASAAVPAVKVEPPLKILESLEAPMRVAVEQIYKQGPQGYKDLYQVSFSTRYPMKTRWKAFMVMARIGGGKSQPEIDKAIESREWFMRSAGLLALEKIDQKLAVEKAKSLFAQDPALMVRAQALEVLRNEPTAETKKLLWAKLYAKENFHRSRGLWIRNKIVSFLADHADRNDLKKIRKLLKAESPELVQLAFPALERILGKKPAADLSAAGQVAYWQQQLKSL